MPDPARRRGLADTLAQLGPTLARFVEEGPGDPAGRDQRLDNLGGALPRAGLGADAVIQQLERLIPDGLPLGASGFCAFVNSAPPVVPTLASLVATVSAPSRWWRSPGSRLERVAVGWLAELLGLPADCPGSLVSGGAMATLTALAAARESAGARRGLDVARDGVGALGSPRVYAGDNVHGVVSRALGVLGLGRRALVLLPSHPERGVDVARLFVTIDADLQAGKSPVAVVATAGDASTGAIDRLQALAEGCQARGIWLHVDASYGGFAVDDPRVSDRLAAINLADSLAIDPHKWLAVPTGVGAVLVRDGQMLSAALRLPPAPYLDGAGGDSAFDHAEGRPAWTIEHSAPARGLVVWAALAELGREGLAARVSRHLDLARRVAARVRAAPELELVAEPVLSTCVFRVRLRETSGSPSERAAAQDRRQAEVVARVRAAGRVVPSLTRVHGALAIRACFLGVENELADADAVVDEVLRVVG